MKKLVEPDDFAIRQVGDLLKRGERFIECPPAYRECLLRCFQSVSDRLVNDLPADLRAQLENFDLIVRRPTTCGVPEYAAEVLRTIWLRYPVFKSLWRND